MVFFHAGRNEAVVVVESLPSQLAAQVNVYAAVLAAQNSTSELSL
jgi:hypothetical protein